MHTELSAVIARAHAVPAWGNTTSASRIEQQRQWEFKRGKEGATTAEANRGHEAR
jgi:hypothetical protein